MNTELSTPETMPQYMFQLSKYKDATHETNNILSAEQNIQQNPIFFQRELVFNKTRTTTTVGAISKAQKAQSF